MDQILTPKFNVMDYWYRFEWQSRGSPHTHGFVWIDGDTPLPELHRGNRRPSARRPCPYECPCKSLTGRSSVSLKLIKLRGAALELWSKNRWTRYVTAYTADTVVREDSS